MADDIDIEEHDPMDNPHIADMFMAHVKSEPEEYEDNYNEYSGVNYEENVPIKEEPIDSSDPQHYPEELQNVPSHSENRVQTSTIAKRNRIILGSKPCPRSKKLKNLFISLEDWGDRLNTSPCYCKECMTLFATRNALDAHKMSVHSFLVAVEAPKEEDPKPKHKFCNHCQTYFEDEALLIQHLYDLIQAKQSKPEEKPAMAPSKPCTSSEIVNIPKQSGVTYNCCKICSCYFIKKTEFDKHCVYIHGAISLPDRVCIPDFSLKHCKFCRASVKSTLSYNRHIRLFHSSSYYRKVTSGAQKTKSTIPSKKMIVSKAKNVYTKSGVSSMNLVKLQQRSHEKNADTAKSNPLINHSNVIKKDYRVSFKGGVPKNVIFKCDKCSKFFLNCLVALTHAYRANYIHNIKTGVWKCSECNRLFRKKDRELHQLQHKHTRDFKVYEVHPNIYSRVLCRCSNCNIYFEERMYLKHRALGCSDTSQVDHCSICDLNVNNYLLHKQKHEMRHFIKSDFILINDFIQFNQTETSTAGSKSAKIPQIKKIAKPNLKRPNTEFPQPIMKKKAIESNTSLIKTHKPKNKPNQIPMYYCNICQVYSMWQPYQKTRHIQKMCKNSVKRIRNCTICGLTLARMQIKTHKMQHIKHNIHFSNYKFICIRTFKPCMPPLPKFRECIKCSVQYVENHKTCEINVKTCKVCKKPFTEPAFRLHMLHHKYLAQGTAKHTNITPVTGESIDMTLKIKYRMLKPTWNILYNCKACDVTTDSYDNVIGHCQKHYNHMESYDVTIKKCEVCDLNFEHKCYERHLKLHENETISRDSFTILPYDYCELLTRDWFKIFTSIPGEQVTQILNRSIYVTRIVKMTMLQNGPPEYTVYKCQTCNKIVATDDICFHVESNDCDAGNRFKCTGCGLNFATGRARESHSGIHKKQQVTANSFRIVAFNHPNEKEFNAKLRLEYTINSPKTVKKTIVKKESNIINTPVSKNGNTKVQRLKYKYYQCQKCYCCSSKRPGILNHVCIPEHRMKICDRCNYVFSFQGMVKHSMKHNTTPMSRADIIMEPLNVPTKPNEWRVQLSECKKCRVKFPSHLIESHKCIESCTLDRAGSVPSMKLYRCSVCKTLFSHKEALYKHEEECNFSDNTKCPCGLNHKEQIYKCNQCGLFMMSKAAVESHNRRNHQDFPVEPCSTCGWNFFSRALRKHISTHHLQLKLSRDDFCIIPIANECNLSAHKSSPKKQHQDSKPKILKKELVDDQELEFENSDKDTIDNVDENEDTAGENSFKKLFSISELERKYKNHKNVLFRCAKCDACYLHIKTWMYHEHLDAKKISNLRVCTICNAKFSGITMKRHLFNHKLNPNVVYTVLTPEETPTRLIGPILNNSVETAVKDDDTNNEEAIKDDEVASTSKVKESESQSATEVNQASPQPDQPTARPESVKQPKVKQPSPRNTSPPSKQYTHKLYKCGECNVYFMAQQTCYSHMLHHIRIDSKEFIECKLCGLPFKLMTLSPHMKKHHHKDDFKLDQVLVEEYTKDGVNKTPKIEIYYAIDKVQSRLVSTTSEEANNDADLASNNQPSSSTNTAEDPVNQCQNDESDVVMEAQSSFTDDDKTVDVSTNIKEDRNLNDDVLLEVKVGSEKHKCRFCDNVFKSKTSMDFHVSLDHLDAEKACEICKSSFNASILDALHLNKKDDTFQCCLCNERFGVQEMTAHSQMHVK